MDRGRRAASLCVLFLALLSLAALGANCRGQGLLAPLPGLPEFMTPVAVAVPGGQVVAAGGNLLVERSDLSLDTRLGTFAVGATYNSADGLWRWSFEPTWDGVTFVEPSGARHAIGALPDGAAVPGTTWVRVDERTMKTKGGLVHRFASDGRLRHVRFASSAYPRLEMVAAPVAGAWRIVRIEQCTASTSCAPAFEITRNGQGRVVRIDDRTGRRAELAYDAEGRLTSARDPLAVARGWPGLRYAYDGGRLVSVENSEGERVAYRYGNGHVVEVEALGEEHPVWRLSYHAATAGLYRTVFVDPTGVVTVLRYDGQRRLHELENGMGEVTRFTWAGRRMASRSLPSGETTTWTWQDDDPATRTEPTGNVVRFTWAPHAVDRGNPHARPLARLEDDLGLLEERSYDAKGRLVAVTNGAGETTTLAYDGAEMLTRVTSPAGLVTRFLGHGEHGHPTRVEASGIEVPFAYDAVGNVLHGPIYPGEAAPSLGGLVARSYDDNRNLHRVTLLEHGSPEILERTLVATRRSDGRLAYLARPYGDDAEFVYDAIGRLVERRERASGTPFAAWNSTRFEHDAAGRPTAFERPNGMREQWVHDAAGRVRGHLILRHGAVESAAAYTRQQGRVTRVEDTVHLGAERIHYDSAGRVLRIEYADGGAQLFTHDLRSRVSATAYTDAMLGFQRTVEFAYDGAGREVVVRDEGHVVIERFYDQGRLASVRYGNGLERAWTYDQITGFPAEIVTAAPGQPPVESTAIGCLVPALLCPEIVTETGGGLHVTSHETVRLSNSSENPYEGLRLYQTLNAPIDASDLRGRTYDLDALSNTMERRESMGGWLCGSTGRRYRYDYNPQRNRLQQIRVNGCSIPAHTYAYDEAGYAVERDGMPIAWDGAGRVVAVGDEASFVWDTLGRPVRRTVDGVTTRLRFGGAVEATPEGIPAALDLGEVRIALGSGARIYRHHDFRHNVKFVTDDAGQVLVHYRYHGYGIDAIFGSGEDTHQRFAQGRALEDLMLLGHRLYDPAAERFLAPDPIYQLVNQFTYTLGNPVLFWDPSGLRMSPTGWLSGFAGVVSTAAGIVALVLAGPAMAPAVALAAGVGVAVGMFGVGVFAAEAIDSVLGPYEGNPSLGGQTQLDLQSGGPATTPGGSVGMVSLRSAAVGTEIDGTRVVSGSVGIGAARWHGPRARSGSPSGASGGGGAGSGGSAGGAGGFGGFTGGGGGGGGGGGCHAPMGADAVPDWSNLLLLLLPLLLMLRSRARRSGWRLHRTT